MKWLENNPLGVALASACGLFILVAVALAYVWSRPASSGAPPPDAALKTAGESRQQINELGPITAYREVTTRPVFDVTRRPSVNISDDEIGLDGELDDQIADLPELKLSGVVITLEESYANISPVSGGKPIIAVAGKDLEGEYEGWSIVEIQPRHIVLASRNGDKVQVDLMVNSRKIEEPPDPVPQLADQTEANGDGTAQGEEQPLSRAEEIRQRIAERREELRRQAEAENSESGAQKAAPTKYQSAIQDMLKARKSEEEKEDGNGNG